MKIAHVTAALDREGAGVRAVVEAVSAAQQAAGHDVRVFGIETRAWMAKDRMLWQGAVPEVMATLGPGSFGYTPGLHARLEQFAPDVIHLHGLWHLNGLVVRSWSRSSGCRFYLSIHGMLAAPALATKAKRKKLAFLLYQRRVIESANHLIATSPAEESEIKTFGLKAPISVVPNGVVVPDHEGSENGHPTVLYLGRLDPIKGIDYLLSAWASLEQEFPGWYLRIVGSAPDNYGCMLKKQIPELGLCRVQIQGALYGADRDKAMAEAAVFVLPSRSENFALTVAESLAVGTPVVATMASPWAGLETNGCGRWVRVGSDPLREGLAELMSRSPRQRAQMGRRGRDWMAAKFNWQYIARGLVNIYNLS